MKALLISVKGALIPLTLMLVLIIGPTACTYFFGGRCPEEPPYFKIYDLNLFHGVFPNDSSSWRLVTNDEVVAFDRYFLSVAFDATYFSEVSKPGGHHLFALSCDEAGRAGAKEGIDTLYVISENDYSDHYLKGDTLNNIVEVADGGIFRKSDLNETVSLSEYIQQNKRLILNQVFAIRLVEPPRGEVDCQFRVIFILTNGERFERVSDKVRLAN